VPSDAGGLPLGEAQGSEGGVLITPSARPQQRPRLEIRAPMGYNLTALVEY
jgi:hypothetical protein